MFSKQNVVFPPKSWTASDLCLNVGSQRSRGPTKRWWVLSQLTQPPTWHHPPGRLILCCWLHTPHQILSPASSSHLEGPLFHLSQHPSALPETISVQITLYPLCHNTANSWHSLHKQSNNLNLSLHSSRTCHSSSMPRIMWTYPPIQLFIQQMSTEHLGYKDTLKQAQSLPLET